MPSRLRAYARAHPAAAGVLLALAELLTLAAVLDGLAAIGGPWVLPPLLPAGFWLTVLVMRAAGQVP